MACSFLIHLFTFCIFLEISQKSLASTTTTLKTNEKNQLATILLGSASDKLNQLVPRYSWTSCTILIAQNENDDHEEFIQRPNLENPLISKILNLKHDFFEIRSFQYSQRFSSPCTVAFYFIPPTQFGLFDEGFIRELPGGIFKSFHNIILTKQHELDSFAKFQKELLPQPTIPTQVGFRNFKQFHHILIVARNDAADEEITDLYTYNLWFNSTFSLLPKSLNQSLKSNELEILLREKHFSIGNQLYPEKWRDLNRGHFIISTSPDSDQEKLEEYIRTKVVKNGGYSASGADLFFGSLNATPVFVINPIFGHKDPISGKWVGRIGDVLNCKVHVGAGIGLSHDRAQVTEYSQPYHFDKVIFLTSLSKVLTSRNSGSTVFLSRPFQAIVWLCVAISFVATYVVLILKKKLDNQTMLNPTKNIFYLLLNILIRPIFDQPNETPNLRAKMRDTLTRAVLTQWLLSVIVLTCLYKSALIAILLVPTKISPPKTFSSLADSDYKIGAVLYNESVVAEYFKALHNRLGHEIDSRVKGYPFSSPECYVQVENFDNRQVCMGISAFIILGGKYFLTDQNGHPLYRVSDDYMFTMAAGFVFPKTFNHLIEQFNRIIGDTLKSGITQHMFYKETRYKAKEGRILAQKLRPRKVDVGPDQGLSHFIRILALGIIISTSIFILEIAKFYAEKLVQKSKIVSESSEPESKPVIVNPSQKK